MGIGLAGIALAVIILTVVPSPAAAATRAHTFRVGPVTLGGYATERGFDSCPRHGEAATSPPCTRTWSTPQGQPIPQQRVMLHHVFFIN